MQYRQRTRERERERENEHYLKRLIMNDCDRFKKIEMEREREGGREIETHD